MVHIKKIGILTLCILFSLAQSAQGVELGLKIAGGLSFLNPSDVNRILQDRVEWQMRDIAAHENWTFLSAKEPQIKRGVEFEGELVFSLGSRFALSLGTGFIYSDLKSTGTEVRVQKPLGETILVQPHTLSALPIMMFGYARFPFSRMLSVYVKGGAGFLWAKYVERYGTKRVENKKFNYLRDESSSAQSPAYVGGMGFFLETEPGIRFFLEGTYRWAKVSDFEGKTNKDVMGPLYYYEEYDFGFWQAKMRVHDQEPSGENIRSVKKAEVDFSGLSIKLGIMIRF
jgi:hypothetical protein